MLLQVLLDAALPEPIIPTRKLAPKADPAAPPPSPGQPAADETENEGADPAQPHSLLPEAPKPAESQDPPAQPPLIKQEHGAETSTTAATDSAQPGQELAPIASELAEAAKPHAIVLPASIKPEEVPAALEAPAAASPPAPEPVAVKIEEPAGEQPANEEPAAAPQPSVAASGVEKLGS